ncbi:MAG TPA: peptide-methionine (S)-S-oxide reductase MsrA [Ideonella sp.]|uniref:peptide-methionine (S)-S-oxide reductase MsrA n=1 Tax=Ideonella sp. TaxID=1929293 RepID=UPI002C17F882|nr:peptide-methionine (S)-S-oxide reductase MsrA [Ideonella sp.]HSI50881.1 peptide-methionine (S)-S-oxide reductase MsrA [Ideonella sp.]
MRKSFHDDSNGPSAATRRRWLSAAAGITTLAAVGATGCMPVSAGETREVPAFKSAEPVAATGNTEVAVLAGGCFWGVQGVFQHVKGVSNAVSGYAGGEKRTAAYQTVSGGGTGHAESVQLTFDPRQISYARLLQIFFSVAHDPTQLNRQGPDQGTQYRSAIFPANDAQAKVAKAYIAQLDQAHVFEAPIVTRLEPSQSFFPAEDYHQDFLTLNPRYPYIVVNDMPKVGALKRLFPAVYQTEPALVSQARR